MSNRDAIVALFVEDAIKPLKRRVAGTILDSYAAGLSNAETAAALMMLVEEIASSAVESAVFLTAAPDRRLEACDDVIGKIHRNLHRRTSIMVANIAGAENHGRGK